MKRILFFLIMACNIQVLLAGQAGLYHFDASGISRPALENYLKRAVTMTEFLEVDPYANDGRDKRL